MLVTGILLVSAYLLRAEGSSLQSIGINLKVKSLKHLAVGTMAGVGILVITAILTKGLVGFQWQLNPSISFFGILLLLNFYFWSALLEELMFRGYGFQRLAQHKGKWAAFIWVGLLFGLAHIHDSMPTQEIVGTMLTTGVGHVFFGLAVLKTKNLALPVGLHQGWNFAQVLVPRHPSLQGESSIWHIVPVDGLAYATHTLFLPYLALMGVGILFLLFYKRTSAIR